MGMKPVVGLVVVMGIALGSCAPAHDGTEDETLGASRQAIGESVTTAKSSYVIGESVVVTFSGLPGNSHDWVTIAPFGAPNVDIRGWRYTAGLTSGAVTIAAPAPAGQYVARAFLDDGLTLLAESAPFSVVGGGAPTTTTDKAVYNPSESVVVSYSNLAGYVHDWLGLAPVGAPPSTVVSWSYTYGRPNGSRAFKAPGPGQYVARSYLNNGSTIQAESAPFTVAAGTTVTRDKRAYFDDEIALFSFTGMSGSPTDWLGIAPLGSDASVYLRWNYVDARISGSRPFEIKRLSGTYVVRAYFNDSLVIEAESEPFTVDRRGTPTTTTDKTTYGGAESVVVSYTGLVGRPNDWVALAPLGSPPTSYVGRVDTGGTVSGSRAFVAPPPGQYVARTYLNGETTVQAESAPFTVTGGASIASEKTSYASNEQGVFRFAGMSGSSTDWIAIAPVGAAANGYVRWSYIQGRTSGTWPLSLAGLGGTYVARAYFANSLVLEAESAPFTVTATP